MPVRIHFIVDMDAEIASFSPFLGAGYLSAYLKSRMGNVETSLSLLSDDAHAAIERHRPDIVGITSTSRFFTRQKETSRAVKEHFGLPVVWGGVHLSITPSDLPGDADVGVLGEGEETLAELLENFRGGLFRNLDRIRGIVYRKEGTLVVNEPRPPIEALDDVPPPDLDLLGVSWGPEHRGVMITSRGCPYRCRFCASSRYWNRTRLHSPDYVVREMESIVRRYKVREILIYDDFFTISKARVAAIADRIGTIPSLRGLRFECLSRADRFDDSLARDLKRMGVYRIAFGIESGCQKTLDYLKNGTLTLDQARRAVRIARDHRFECVGSFIIGSPAETAEEIEETLTFIRGLGLDGVQITIATPFPGTELWEDGKRAGRITGDDWSDAYYVMHSNSPDFDLVGSLEGKTVLSPIDRSVFLGLVGKATALANSINYSRKNIVKYSLRSIRRDPLGVPGKIVKGVRLLLGKW